MNTYYKLVVWAYCSGGITTIQAESRPEDKPTEFPEVYFFNTEAEAEATEKEYRDYWNMLEYEASCERC